VSRSTNRRRTKVAHVELQLPDIDALFERPRISPFSPDFQPSSYASGMEILADRMYADRRLTTIEATFALPPDQLAATTHDDISAAIRRYTAAKIEESDIHVRADTTRGRRAMLIALPAVTILLLITAWFEQTTADGFVAETVIAGLWIGVWVSLWFPIDKLFWGVWTNRSDRLIYERLRDMHFTLKPE